MESPYSITGNQPMKHFVFSKMEFSGSLGDLGTILPLSLGMIIINGVDAPSVFLCFGLFYILSGYYFKVTSPAEPMKIIAAYSIAANVTVDQIQASSLLMAIILFALSMTGVISLLGKTISRPIIRGIQLSTGTLLFIKGLELIAGKTKFQQMQNAVEPYFTVQNIGPIPIGIIIGVFIITITLILLNNRKFPAALSVVAIGFVLGFFLHKNGTGAIHISPSLPEFFKNGLPALEDIQFAFLFLVLPQIPMTIGNAVIANADLSAQYFPQTGKRVTPKALSLSMSGANALAFFLGGIPMCHGAGGLASRYRFGARTGGSNLMIGVIFLLLALLFGKSILSLLTLLPLSVLGALLLFAGIQLAMTITDISKREDVLVALVILGLTLTFNLTIGFLVAIILQFFIRRARISI